MVGYDPLKDFLDEFDDLEDLADDSPEPSLDPGLRHSFRISQGLTQKDLACYRRCTHRGILNLLSSGYIRARHMWTGDVLKGRIQVSGSKNPTG